MINFLIQMGDHLQAIDHVQEKNEMGFNKLDFARWSLVRGDAQKMAAVLKKYLNTQLIPIFGHRAAEVIEKVLSQAPKVEPVLNPKFGSIMFKLIGLLPKSLFNQFVDVNRKYGTWWDKESGMNYVPRKFFDTFKFLEYVAELEALGLDVGPLPSLSAPAVKTAKEAFDLIDSRVPNTFACRFIDGFFVFRFSFSYELNALFSNKTGQLSGIMEVNPKDWSRKTRDLNLAREAIIKARELLPNWTYIIDDFSQIEKEQRRVQDTLRAPIQEISTIISKPLSLFPFQNEFVRFIDSAGGNCLIGAEMGLGKTIIALAWAAKHKLRVLVVGPKVTRRNWVNEARTFFPSYYINAIELTPKLKNDTSSLSKTLTAQLVSINYHSLEKFLPIIQVPTKGFDLLIIDESHSIKSPKAKITKTINLIAPYFKYKILLSGTAIKNKKQELFTQIELVRPGMFEDAIELRNATIGGTWNKIQECYKTKSKAEVLPDLPTKTSVVIEIDVESCTDFPEDNPPMFEDIMKMKHDVSFDKSEATIEFIKEMLDSSDSCMLVFTDFVDVAERIHRELGPEVALLHHGGLSDNVREGLKESFQGGCVQRVFVSTRQSLAVGATLTRADKVVFNDLPWTPADIRQAEDRTHRIGQVNPVNVYWIKAAANNWDNKVIGILRRKYDISRKILEGKQVTQAEKDWMEQPISKEFKK